MMNRVDALEAEGYHRGACVSGTTQPVAARYNGAWRSLVAHLLWEQGVGGSNPSAPTKTAQQALTQGTLCARSSAG